MWATIGGGGDGTESGEGTPEGKVGIWVPLSSRIGEGEGDRTVKRFFFSLPAVSKESGDGSRRRRLL